MSSTTAWLLLLAGGLFEIVWASALKYSEQWTRLWPSVIAVVFMILSVVLLERSLKVLPVGTAYAVWTGIGAVGTALFGMIVLGESREVLRLVCIGLIVASIVGLKLLGSDGS